MSRLAHTAAPVNAVYAAFEHLGTLSTPNNAVQAAILTTAMVVLLMAASRLVSNVLPPMVTIIRSLVMTTIGILAITTVVVITLILSLHGNS